MVYCLFFFQAEDGIRDYKVTGVQTCALPISLSTGVESAHLRGRDVPIHVLVQREAAVRRLLELLVEPFDADFEIGRASCRERGYIEEGEVSEERRLNMTNVYSNVQGSL